MVKILTSANESIVGNGGCLDLVGLEAKTPLCIAAGLPDSQLVRSFTLNVLKVCRGLTPCFGFPPQAQEMCRLILANTRESKEGRSPCPDGTNALHWAILRGTGVIPNS